MEFAGSSISAHLEAARKAKGLPPPAPKSPFPRAASRVWGDFVALHGTRTAGGFSANPIGYVEIDSYSKLLGANLSPWEVEAIRKLDELWLKVQGESAPQETGT